MAAPCHLRFKRPRVLVVSLAWPCHASSRLPRRPLPIVSQGGGGLKTLTPPAPAKMAPWKSWGIPSRGVGVGEARLQLVAKKKVFSRLKQTPKG